MLKAGDKAPDFTLKSETGEPFSFHQHLEKDDRFHLLVFFRGEWCPVCNDQLKELEQNIDTFNELNTHILAISTDESKNLNKMKETHSLSFPVFSDPERAAAEPYGVQYHTGQLYEDHGEHGEPALFLVDDQKRVLYFDIQTGPFGRPTAEDLRKTIKYIKKTLQK
ncbi:peroxiredoxin family protein [Fictibacillus halophilus]|uniref:peroxiredoxin family protein n=1 Tax=Fictibacillus halophilus TaxID=1610490 RepID=UPI0036372BF5